VESRDDILRASLEDALVSARSLYGSEDGDGWRWDRVQTANLYHLLNIEAFSALGLPIQGGPETLNPVSGSGRHGASWRMVVELGERVEAKGTYPGGQSGNPLSPDYLDRLEFWTGGELRELRFPRTASELEGVSRGVASLRPSGTR
jgi:penicillin amidase